MLTGDENMPLSCVCGCFADDHAADGSCNNCGGCSMLEEDAESHVYHWKHGWIPLDHKCSHDVYANLDKERH